MKKLLLAVLAVLAFPSTAPADVLCVAPASFAGCDLPYAQNQLQAALDEAASAGEQDTVRIGAAAYSNGPFSYFAPGGGADVIQGAGQGQTALSAPADPLAQNVLLVIGGGGVIVRDLTINMADNTATSEHDVGIYAQGGSVDSVTVNGQNTDNSEGIVMVGGAIEDSTVNMALQPANGGRGVMFNSSGSITDTAVTANSALEFSSTGGVLTASRLRISAGRNGVSSQAGTIELDTALIDLNVAPNATGIRAENGNPGTAPKAVNARHVSIVGGGPSSKGVRAATGVGAAATATQSSVVTLADSLIEGPAVALQRIAGNDGGGKQPSTSQITTSYSNYDATTNSDDDNADNGAGAITQSNRTNHDPQFVAPGSDYHLAPSSPLIDIGDPASGGPAADIDGHARVQDGNDDTVARRDIGADEVRDVSAPAVSLTSGPSGPTTDATPSFAFTMNPGDPASSFECRFDGEAFSSCDDATPGAGAHSAPTPLAEGPHTFEVRARDNIGNFGTSATRAFVVDTAAPAAPSLTGGPSGPTRDQTPTFTFGGEAGAAFTCAIDGGPAASCAGSYTPGALGDGPHTLTVRQTDAVGHESPPAVRAFTVDTLAPATAFKGKRLRRTRDRTPTFRFGASEAGSTFECRIDRGKFRPCAARHTTKRLKPGRHVLRVRALDAAGNSDPTPAMRRFRVLR